jgi:hypothetical protein
MAIVPPLLSFRYFEALSAKEASEGRWIVKKHFFSQNNRKKRRTCVAFFSSFFQRSLETCLGPADWLGSGTVDEPNAVLICGRCIASSEEQEQEVCFALYRTQFGGSSNGDLATTERCSALWPLSGSAKQGCLRLLVAHGDR